jgi:Na+/H+-dicarboxylate symporter
MFIKHLSPYKKLIQSVFFLYSIAVILGIISGYMGFAQDISDFITQIFVKIFKCISLPIIALSIMVSLSQSNANDQLKGIWKRTFLYTVSTTIAAAFVACLLYVLISPQNVSPLSVSPSFEHRDVHLNKYYEHLMSIIPLNIFSPFLENNVIGTLFISIVIGVATRCLPDSQARCMVAAFFKAIHDIFLIITGWIVKIIPIALFGFISTAVIQLKNGVNFKGLGGYLSVVVLANIIQGFLILPVFLRFNRINPFEVLKKMLPALSVAFFSKTSTGTLPVTMKTAEQHLGISPAISRFVLPLCTSINMNGCAAFIFTTVIYGMQNYGMNVGLSVMLQWIVVSTITAIGNAGVPMGCFFLSVSLLTSMEVPTDLLWIILPFYSVIDMIETALNVWSDCCVTKVIDQQYGHLTTPHS